jgi:hypothetical protein
MKRLHTLKKTGVEYEKSHNIMHHTVHMTLFGEFVDDHKGENNNDQTETDHDTHHVICWQQLDQ